MSHTLFREGTPQNLKGDFNVIVRPERGLNSEGVVDKLKIILDIFKNHNVVNFGDVVTGTKFTKTIEEIYAALAENTPLICGNVDTKEDLMAILLEIIHADFGLSVVVTGLYDDIVACCQQLGLKVHSTNHSLGVWGKVDILPPASLRQITTMCGHGMVPASLVESVIEDVSNGKLSLKDGAAKLARPCSCGCFNPNRAERLIKDLLHKS